MPIIGIILGAILLAIAATAYICFRIAFYVPERKPVDPNHYDIPEGDIYEPFREQMIQWIDEVRHMPQEEMAIQSFDGLTLRGKYFEYAPGAPIELMLHGYRGNSERDMGGGVQRCFALGRSALIVDQRACGASDGKVISFGVNESLDCRMWVEHMIRRFGPDVKIILTGISMGAATVLMAAGEPLPKNVIGVLADCGYTSAREIIQLVIRQQMHLPDRLSYPFVKLGARLFGKFDLDALPPVEAVKKCTVPVIFFHGEDDDFVPCQMSRDNYEACASKKAICTVPGAGHGLSFLVDQAGYLKAVAEFFGPEASAKSAASETV